MQIRCLLHKLILLRKKVVPVNLCFTSETASKIKANICMDRDPDNRIMPLNVIKFSTSLIMKAYSLH